MLPHRLHGYGTEYTVAFSSISDAENIFPHLEHRKSFQSILSFNILIAGSHSASAAL